VSGGHGNRSVTWLSLDESDRQPATFCTYVITALQTAVPDVLASVLALLQTALPPIESVLAVLNELSAVPNDVDLVLDDYHLVDRPDVRPGMAFLLEHLPPQFHLVIKTPSSPTTAADSAAGARSRAHLRRAQRPHRTGLASAYSGPPR